MIFSIPVWLICQIINLFILTPLHVVGYYIMGDWATALSSGIQFFFRPLLYWQGIIDVPFALRSLGWDIAIFEAWLTWLGINWIIGIIRGNQTELNP